MRFAEDSRGRVPFALVGVLLLVGGTTYATTLSGYGSTPVDRDVEIALDRTTAASEAALQTAVVRAARDAARTPVVTPATTQWGDVVNGSTPFRDTLRLRIYVETRRALATSSHRSGDVVADATLPSTPNASTLRSAKRRVHVEGVENGTALRVTVRGVRLAATQDGDVVVRETSALTRTVPTPVLALHDRTARFQRRLDRGPLEGPGLGQRLTGRLYPVAWSRGYAQYGGLPVSNVLGSRHVALSTNAAALELQREAFGRADPTAMRALRRATAGTVARDGAALVSTPVTDVVGALDTGERFPAPNDAPRAVPRIAPDDAPGPDRPLTVGVNHSADRGFSAFLSRGNATLGDVLERSYRAELRLRATSKMVDAETRPDVERLGPEWELVDEDVDTTATVREGRGPVPAAVDGWHRFDAHTRRVTVRHRITWSWRRGNRTSETSAAWTQRFAVGVAVDGRHAPPGLAPDRPLDSVFERGGPLDGPNLADVPPKSGRYLDQYGGVDAVVAGVATGRVDPSETGQYVGGARPDRLTEWTRDDVEAFHQRVRRLHVTVRAGDVASGAANPAATLAATLRERRPTLVAAPERYDGVAERARFAARAAYLDRTIAQLERRANQTGRTNDDIVAALDRTALAEAERVRAVAENHTLRPPRPRTLDGPLGGPDVFVPQGGPAYLDVRGVDGSRVPDAAAGDTYHGLTTRNLNVYTVPYAEASTDAVDSAAGPKRVRLRTAAGTLAAADREIAAGNGTAELRTRRDRLADEVETSIRVIRDRSRRTLAEETSLPRAERRSAVRAALNRWNGTAAEALAVTNGSFVDAVVEGAAVEPDARPRLRVELRVTVVDARNSSAVSVPRTAVDGATAAVHRVLTTAASEAAKRAATDASDRLQRRHHAGAGLFAGLPVLPAPGYWYATVNVWGVEAHGKYRRFAVRTRRGSPGETLTYVRDGGVARLDVDGDGDAERLGRADRIAFDVSTVVVVAVPSGGSGVGDVDGVANETSSGWKRPGCLRACRPE